MVIVAKRPPFWTASRQRSGAGIYARVGEQIYFPKIQLVVGSL
jgi:hypothetical protein